MPFTAATAATIATVATVASTAVGVAGAITSGRSAAQSARFQADVASQNARISRQRGEAEGERRRRVSARRLGSLRAREAPLDVIADAASELELDALLAEFEGELGARDFSIQAGAARFRGESALAASRIGAVGQAIGGVGNLAQLGILTRTTGPGVRELPEIAP